MPLLYMKKKLLIPFTLLIAAMLNTSAETRMEVRPGLETKPLAAIDIDAPAEAITLENGLRIRVSTEEKGDLLELRVDYVNEGADQLEVEFVVVHEFFPEDYPEYWDGTLETHEIALINGPHVQDNIRRMAPWTGIFGAEDGVGMGLDPLQLKSFIASRLIRDESMATLEFATRVAVSPGEEGDIVFFVSRFSTRFGGIRELTQRVHNAYPDVFSPNPNAYPVFYGASAHYWMSRINENNIPGKAPIELMRRVHATWDWSYAPFKRTGDHWGFEELWDYTPNVPFSERRAGIVQNSFHFNEVSRDDFMGMRARHFNNWGRLHGMLFYSPAGVWVEKRLAEDFFEDALIVDPDYRYELASWVTGWDREVKVFPWYTSYEPFLRESFEIIAETYDISGIAMDVARGGPKYRGPATDQPVLGRAYDEKGVFLDQGVGVANFIDFLHTLPVRFSPEHVLAVIGNPETGGQTFTVTTRYDAGMYEGPPYHRQRAAIPLARYLLGQKPLNWWTGWMYTRYAVPNWENFGREHFEETMNGLIDYVIFSSFEWGAIPTANYQWGIPRLNQLMPDIIACVRTGWQAVFPVTHTAENLNHLHTARYGMAGDTILFWGNPYEDDQEVTADVDNSYLDEYNLIFVDWLKGTPLMQKIETGSTRLHFNLESRTPILHRALLALSSETSIPGLTATAERSFGAIQVNVDFAQGTPSTSLFLAGVIGYTLDKVLVDNKPLALVATSTTPWETSVMLPGGASNLQLFYTRTLLGSSPEEILGAEIFGPKGEILADVQIDVVDAVADDVRIRLEQYLAYYSEVPFFPSGPYARVGMETDSREKIIVSLDPDSTAGVTRDLSTRITRLQAPNAAQLHEVIDNYLSLLDEKYPYLPPMRGTWGTDEKLLRHVGYNNGYLMRGASE